jgi:hypothetical protein
VERSDRSPRSGSSAREAWAFTRITAFARTSPGDGVESSVLTDRHLMSIAGWPDQTVPSRLSAVDLQASRSFVLALARCRRCTLTRAAAQR